MENDLRNPLLVRDTYWLWSYHPGYREMKLQPQLLGKWLIMCPNRRIDAAWKKIAEATMEGRLGVGAKVSTAYPKENVDSSTKVICVYTYDFHDTNNLLHILQELRALGFTGLLSYKTDEMTRSGKEERLYFARPGKVELLKPHEEDTPFFGY